ncbi:MAG: nuclear transport factor 2 family protein [Sphingobium sp.]|nr:nuclear transport factor 2 family protein [Sphingobium sp.]
MTEIHIEQLARSVRALEDRQQITDVLHRYARGWDRFDADALYASFHPDSTHQHGGFEGLSVDFIKFGLEMCAPVHAMTHLITNVSIWLDGDRATSECHFLAHHRRDSDGGGQEDMFLKGRYLDRFDRRAGEWRIAHRLGLHDFERIVQPADRTLADAPADQLGHRKPHDPLYAMLASL